MMKENLDTDLASITELNVMMRFDRTDVDDPKVLMIKPNWSLIDDPYVL